MAVLPAFARQGGDLGVCRVDVEGSDLIMPVGPALELGSRGKAICFKFYTDVDDALAASKSAEAVEVKGGSGLSIDDPVDIGGAISDENPLIAILTHYRGTAEGRFVHFELISRAEERYVVEIAAKSADGAVTARYFNYAAWVQRQLKAS
jgi:hypothetical protein